MSDNSTISWTDATWPIVAGCEYASPGCSNCWAVRDSWRLAHNPNASVRRAYADTVRKTKDGKLVWTGVVRVLPERLPWPLKWRSGRMVFVCSQADLFHPGVPFDFIAAAFGIMAMAQHHTFQVLTKHPRRARSFFEWLPHQRGGSLSACLWHARKLIGEELANRNDPHIDELPQWPLENVWFGVTVEDQLRADERIPELLRIPAAKRWLSVEPMLEEIRVQHPDLADLDWVVCGGESAQTRAHTRPFDIQWARELRDQCAVAGVPFFMKQLGTAPNDRGAQWGKLPGKTSRYKWHEPQHWPEDLRIQEFPHG